MVQRQGAHLNHHCQRFEMRIAIDSGPDRQPPDLCPFQSGPHRVSEVANNHDLALSGKKCYPAGIIPRVFTENAKRVPTLLSNGLLASGVSGILGWLVAMTVAAPVNFQFAHAGSERVRIDVQ